MNTLVVYDSQFGNTEQIAQTVADTLTTYGPARAARANLVGPAEAERADLLLFGSPTQGWRPTGVMASFLAALVPARLRGKAVACFDTRFHRARWLTGSASHIMARSLTRNGTTLVVPPESFFVVGTEGPLETGEIERAATWAQTIARQIAAPHAVAS